MVFKIVLVKYLQKLWNYKYLQICLDQIFVEYRPNIKYSFIG